MSFSTGMMVQYSGSWISIGYGLGLSFLRGLCETAKYKNLKAKLLMAIEIAIDGLTNISPLVFTFSEHDRRSLWTGLFLLKKTNVFAP